MKDKEEKQKIWKKRMKKNPRKIKEEGYLKFIIVPEEEVLSKLKDFPKELLEGKIFLKHNNYVWMANKECLEFLTLPNLQGIGIPVIYPEGKINDKLKDYKVK